MISGHAHEVVLDKERYMRHSLSSKRNVFVLGCIHIGSLKRNTHRKAEIESVPELHLCRTVESHTARPAIIYCHRHSCNVHERTYRITYCNIFCLHVCILQLKPHAVTAPIGRCEKFKIAQQIAPAHKLHKDSGVCHVHAVLARWSTATLYCRRQEIDIIDCLRKIVLDFRLQVTTYSKAPFPLLIYKYKTRSTRVMMIQALRVLENLNHIGGFVDCLADTYHGSSLV